MARQAKKNEAAEKPAKDPAVFNYLNIMDEKGLDNAIRKVVRHYQSHTAREELHLVMVACCEHAMKHNSGDKLTNLWLSLPNNAPHRSMAAWIHNFTNLRFTNDRAGAKKWMGRNKDNQKVNIALLNWDKARIEPFYDMDVANADRDNPPFDPWKAVENLVKRLQNELKKDTFANDPVKEEFAREIGDNIINLRKRIESKVQKAQNTGENVTEANFEDKPAKQARA
jgi:hypothetical protein